jgi:F-type H+-transporting ATPase subunit alpha
MDDRSATPHMPLLDVREVGFVKDVRRGIVRINGLPSCVYGQLLRFPNGAGGLVMSFDLNEVMAIILGDENGVSVGDEVVSYQQRLTIPVGENFIGRIVNSIGIPLDNKGDIPASDQFPVFAEAYGVMDREPVTDAFMTGIKMIDLTIPIGKGQRQLIIGDRQTGKTSIAIDTIINQKDSGVICIYCWIGGSQSALKRILNTLHTSGALKYTIIVAASADTSAAEQYLAPYSAAALGEYFMKNGKDVCVVFDDLTKHAWIYRQMSLLLERSPGREAYPGDIFYLHSNLLERAGRLKKELGGGTMTFLPVVETLQGDITGYIQTNLISITDGQIYISSALFREAFKPSIDLGLSVSRIGSRVQYPAIRHLGAGLRLEYAQYREMLRMTKLRTRLSDEAEEKFRQGEVLYEIFQQINSAPISVEEEIVLFYGYKRKVLEVVGIQNVRIFMEDFFKYTCANFPELVTQIREKRDLTPEIRAVLDQSIRQFFKELNAKQNNANVLNER